MADTQTPNIKITNQTEGGNNNTWGQIADANFERIDDKFGDVTTINTTGGTTTLTDTQEIVNTIVVTGTLATNSVIVFSGRGGTWVVKNGTAGAYSVTCKVSGQTGVTIDQGATTVVYCNGTDIAYAVEAAAAAAEVTVASASTTNVLGAASEFVAISGTTTITSFGTGTNRKRFCRATGAFKITHNATSLVCPGMQDILCASGDTFIVVGDSSSNATIVNFQRAAAPPQALPIGSVVDYAGATAPPYWLFAYGQEVSRTTYAALFAAIGVQFGSGNGTTTFALPDLRGRVSAGRDNMGGSSAGRLTGQTGGVGDSLGAVGGSETHTLTTAQLASHTHSASTGSNGDHTHTVPRSLEGFAASGTSSPATQYTAAGTTSTSTNGAHTHSVTVDAAGGGSPHNNVQPTIVLNKIIYAGV